MPKQKAELPYYELGRVPPQATDLEEAVLGAIMIDKGALEEAMEISITPNIFYKDAHQLIVKAIINLWRHGNPVDILTVREELQTTDDLEAVGGVFYISQLTNKVASTISIEYWIRIIMQKYLRREVIRLSAISTREAFENDVDVFDLIDKTQTGLDNLDPRLKSKSSRDSTNITEQLERSVFDAKKDEAPLYYETKWPKFNRLVGTSKNRIVVIAGANGEGKSRFVATWMFQLLDKYPNVSILWYCLEDDAIDMLLFYLANKVGLKTKDIKLRKFDSDKKQAIINHTGAFRDFDIQFREHWDKVVNISRHFKKFCRDREDRLNILVIDNILSLQDRQDFKGKINEMYDYIYAELLAIRQSTKGMIVVVHHFTDEQSKQERLKTGYMPVESDIKGTEGVRRIATSVGLINNPGRKKNLLAEYDPDAARVLKHLFILDPSKTRDDSNVSNEEIIYFIKSLDYNIFIEVDQLK